MWDKVNKGQLCAGMPDAACAGAVAAVVAPVVTDVVNEVIPEKVIAQV